MASGKGAEIGDAGRDFDGSPEDTIGLEVRHGDRCFHLIPGCAAMTDDLARHLGGSPLVFFNGTTWSDTEMASTGTGTGTKTARRMGHMPMAGPGGTLAAFAGLEVGRKVFVHISNTNPAILDDSTIDHVPPDYHARQPKACMGGWGRKFLNVTRPAGCRPVMPPRPSPTSPLKQWERGRWPGLGRIVRFPTLPRHRLDA